MPDGIERVGAEALESIRPVWLALRRHHGEIAPELGPLWPEETSWSKRRAMYETLLAEEDAIILVARKGDAPVGLAVMTIDPGSHTWRHPERYGWVHDIVVLPEARGTGLGERLIEALWEALHAAGVGEMRLAVVPGNEVARRFYERMGFQTGPFIDLVGRRPPPAGRAEPS